MTFLNPLALFGLIAAALPLLLHLFNLRKLKTVEFSTLTFLKELQKTRIRRLKLRQILLLILRTLLIVLIVAAFSRPTLRGSVVGAVGAHAKTTAVFLIDDSFSMTMSDEHGELLKQAKLTAENTNHFFADGDEIFLIRLSSLPSWTSGHGAAVRDFGLLRKNIEDIKPSAIRHSLEDGLRGASKLLASSGNFNKEVYVFSDFQQGVLSDNPVENGAKERLFSPEVRFFPIQLGKPSVQNFGVESVTIPSTVLERDKPFVIQVQIGNFTDNSVQDHVVGVFLNGTRVAERSIDLPKHSSVPVEFSVAAAAVGYIQGFVEIEDDEFPYDNRRYFVLHIPDQIRVLLVGTEKELQYPRLALRTRASDTESALTLSEAAPDRLNATMIRRSDVVMLCTTQGFSSAQISELRSYVNDGGGVALFAGSQIDPNGFNAQFVSGLGLPSCSGVDRPSNPRTETGSYTEFDRVEMRHPIFEGMFAASPQTPTRPGAAQPQPEQNRIESPRIRACARFAVTARSNLIITLENGAPFLTEQTIGSGRIFLFAVPPTIDWSDFPLKGLFVPMIHRTVLYLAHQQTSTADLLPGNEIVVRSNSVTPDLWTIRNPQNVEVTAAPTRQSFQRMLRFASTEQPGLYDVSSNGTTLQKFVVNLDSRESRLDGATPADLTALFGRLGIEAGSVHTVHQTSDLERGVLESRFGVELWKYFLMLALAAAIIEQLIARTSKREIGA